MKNERGVFEINADEFNETKKIEVKLAEIAKNVSDMLGIEIGSAEGDNDRITSIIKSFIPRFISMYEEQIKVGVLDSENPEMTKKIYNQEDLNNFITNTENIVNIVSTNKALSPEFSQYLISLERILKEAKYNLSKLEENEQDGDGERVAA